MGVAEIAKSTDKGCPHTLVDIVYNPVINRITKCIVCPLVCPLAHLVSVDGVEVNDGPVHLR